MADYQYVNDTGLIVPDVATILGDVQQEYKNAFGQDLIVSPSTPQGILINAEVLARIEVIRNNAAVANQINPNFAGGVFLDAIGALTASQRSQETFSQLPVTVAGVAGTVIPNTVTAADDNGNVYQNTAIITLDSSGNGTGNFQAVNPGAISTNINTLTTIINGVLGWETITNTAASTPGSATQSDQSFKIQRRNTLALQGQGLPEAIQSGLNNLAQTTGQPISLTFRENFTDGTLVIDGITLVEHSMYTCVGGINGFGGATDLEVAQVLLSKKDCGCDWNGSTTVNVTDPVSGQTYPVTFDRPTFIPILVRVTIKANSSIADPTTVVKNALLAYMNGQLTDENGFSVGIPVSCFELAGAINQAAPSIYVINVETTKASSISYSNSPIPIALNEEATCGSTNIVVVITP